MSESTKYEDLKNGNNSIVYVIQEVPGTKANAPKINIMGAAKYGKFEFLLPEFSQDYLLLTGDPAIIGVACSIASDITNGKYNLLKWDRQERAYYPININLYEKGEINEY